MSVTHTLTASLRTARGRGCLNSTPWLSEGQRANRTPTGTGLWIICTQTERRSMRLRLVRRNPAHHSGITKRRLVGEATLEQLFVPWWKVVVYLIFALLALFSFKVRVQFNVNDWLQKRADAKALKEWQERASNCTHSWTLYSYSIYSQCNLCQAYIETATLVFAQRHLTNKPSIIAENTGARIEPSRGEPVVVDYVGAVSGPLR